MLKMPISGNWNEMNAQGRRAPRASHGYVF
jgi:hypothetical protein